MKQEWGLYSKNCHYSWFILQVCSYRSWYYGQQDWASCRAAKSSSWFWY